MLNLNTLATQLNVSINLLKDIESTLQNNGVEVTPELIQYIYLDFIKGKKGINGNKGTMSYLATKAAEQAREKTQPQLGLMQNMQTLERQLVNQFDSVTVAVADKVNATLVRNAVARTVASNLDEMPETRALLDQIGNFTTQTSAGYKQEISPEDSLNMLLTSAATHQSRGNTSFLLSASTENLLNPSQELLEQNNPEVEQETTAIA